MPRCLAVGRKAARQLMALAGQQGIQAVRIGPDTLSIAGRTARLKVAYHGYKRLERLLQQADLCFIRMGTSNRWLALMPAESLVRVLGASTAARHPSVGQL